MAALKIIWKFLSNFPYHSFSVGAGTLLVGVAALIALCKTDGVIDKLYEIKDAVDRLYEIKDAVSELKDNVKLLQNERTSISSLRKAPEAERIYSPLKNGSKTNLGQDLLQERRKDLKQLLPDEKSDLKPGDIYLPSEDFSKLEGKLKTQDWGDDINTEKFLSKNFQIWNPDKVKN